MAKLALKGFLDEAAGEAEQDTESDLSEEPGEASGEPKLNEMELPAERKPYRDTR